MKNWKVLHDRLLGRNSQNFLKHICKFFVFLRCFYEAIINRKSVIYGFFMDGAPVKGESIPIRVFLAGYDLTPTMRDINKKFSVR